jgi:hypothetical protein
MSRHLPSEMEYHNDTLQRGPLTNPNVTNPERLYARQGVRAAKNLALLTCIAISSWNLEPGVVLGILGGLISGATIPVDGPKKEVTLAHRIAMASIVIPVTILSTIGLITVIVLIDAHFKTSLIRIALFPLVAWKSSAIMISMIKIFIQPAQTRQTMAQSSAQRQKDSR